MSTLALSWTLHHPRVDAAIIGPRSPSHLDAALASTEVELSPDDWTRLAALFASAAAR